jgi:molecular chaperone GrpE
MSMQHKNDDREEQTTPFQEENQVHEEFENTEENPSNESSHESAESFEDSQEVDTEENQSENQDSSEVENSAANEPVNEVEEWKNKSLRLAADLQNLSKQHDLDTAQVKKSVKKQTISAVLTFLNTLNLAFSYIPQTEDQKVLSFIQTLKTSFEKVKTDLQGIGIEILIPEVGEEFDASFMTLLNSTEDDTAAVKQVVSIGLKIDGQLIQPASVMV